MKDRWDTATFVTNYLPLALFPVMYLGARFWRREPFVKPADMDFISGLAEIEAEWWVFSSSFRVWLASAWIIADVCIDCSYDEPPPRNWVERFWSWLVSIFDMSLSISS